jgi:hypothetical protein
MLPKFNTQPVPEERIAKIQEMLNDPIVGEAWHQFVNLGQPHNHMLSISQIKLRDKAWAEYARLRDEYLKLPPLSIPIMQGTQARYRN